MSMSITLIDATADSLTVSWPETKGAVRYILQYRRAMNSDAAEFESLSENLTTTQAKKKHLADENQTGFFFRVGALLRESDDVPSWISHPEPFHLLPASEHSRRMEAPTVVLAGSVDALVVQWKPPHLDGDVTYELQMRENVGGAEWKTIATSLQGTQVRKKNLSSRNGYQFRVRPESDDGPYSLASSPAVSLGLADGVKRLFGTLANQTLLRKFGEPVTLEEALGGKEFVLLYCSAHWCGPCRQFTPKLTQWYRSLGAANGRTVEVVFLSADHDQKGFEGYYQQMPWLAVPYEDNAREGLMAHLRVSGIPRLAVLDGRTGRIIEDNAVGKTMDLTRWRSLVQTK